MPNGKLYAICIMRTQEEVGGVVRANHSSNKKEKLTIQQVHEKLGHINGRATKKISKELGWELTSNESLNCVTCAAGKAKQKLLNKISIQDPNDEKDGYRAYLDISTIKKSRKYPEPTSPNWCLIVDGTKLKLKFLHFFKSKNVMVEPTCELLHHWSKAGKILASCGWTMLAKIKNG